MYAINCLLKNFQSFVSNCLDHNLQCFILQLIYFVLIYIYISNFKDDVERLLFVGNLAKDDSLDMNPKTLWSETLYSPKKSPNCHSKGDQHLITHPIGNIQDSTKR